MLLGDATGTGRSRRLADSEDSDDEKNDATLTAARAAELCPVDYRLIARKGGFTALDDLSALSSLDYIDLSGNQLTSLQGVNSNWRLKTLNVRSNKLSDINPILLATAVRVLNISENRFSTTEWLSRAAFSSQLLTLVATGNQLSRLENLVCLSNIQTLVVSGNQIEDIIPVTRLTSLVKLSVSNNVIRKVPSEIGNLRNLTELRLAHNKVSLLPAPEIIAKLNKLSILDIGHNRMSSLESLSGLRETLTSINVRNNPASQREDIVPYVQTLCPKLEVIDGKRIAGGRRKLRINRLRTAAGLAIETDREFVRAPSAYYLKKAGLHAAEYSPTAKRARSSSDDLRGASTSLSEPGTRKSEEVENPNSAARRKRTVDSGKDGKRTVEEGDIIRTEDFLERARAKKKSFAEKQETPVTVTGTKDDRGGSKVRHKKRRTGTKPLLEEFGTGGESKWE